MNNDLKTEIVVTDIAGKRAVIECQQAAVQDQLLSIGFARESNALVRAIASDADRATLVKTLVGMKALFSAGRDWSPEELVGYYHEKGIINEPYRVIIWRGPGKYVIEERGIG